MKLAGTIQGSPEQFPVEVREEDFTLQAKGPLKEAIDGLSAGTYVVTVKLPEAESLTAKVEIPAHVPNDAASPADELIGRVWEQVDRRASHAALTQAFARPDEAPPRLQDTVAKIFYGDPLRGPITGEAIATDSLQDDANNIWRLAPDTAVRVLQLVCKDGWHLNIVVPPFTQLQVDLRLTLDREIYAISFPEIAVNNLFGLQVAGQLEQVAASVKDFSENAVIELLRSNYGSGLAVCYAMLRSTEASRLQMILASDDLRCGADMFVLTGEMLARSGKNRAALQTFMRAAESGLPCFTDGVNTLFDRLNFYRMAQAAEGEGLLVSQEELAHQRSLIARLRHFAPACDQTAVLTSFWGADPNAPVIEEGSHLESGG